MFYNGFDVRVGDIYQEVFSPLEEVKQKSCYIVLDIEELGPNLVEVTIQFIGEDEALRMDIEAITDGLDVGDDILISRVKND